jgi:hypothetical protein
MTNLLKVDHSSSNSYYSCPRKYKLAHIDGWTSVYGSTALRAGSTFHTGLEGFYSHIQKNGWTRDGKAIAQMIEYAAKEYEEESKDRQFYDDYRTLENVITVLTQYVDHFHSDHGFLEVLHTERAFKLLMQPSQEDLKNWPNLKPFYFTGKIDMECKINGLNWTNEFKTTGWRLDQVVNELNRSPQIMGYAYAKDRIYDEAPEGCFATIAFFTSRKSPKTGEYGKLTVDFRRVPQIFNSYDLSEWRKHFISLVAGIQNSIETNHFPPRFQSCYNYGRCEFLNICEQSCPIAKASFYGYKQEEPWDVTKEVSPEDVMEAEEEV